MKVGYFGRPLGLTGGIARYTTRLLDAILHTAPEINMQVFTNREIPAIEGAVMDYGPARLGRVGWEQLYLPGALKRAGVDIYHSPDFTLPLAVRAPSVITVHDLIFLRQPEGTSWRARLLYSALTKASVRKAKAVIAVSDFTARDIMEYHDIPSSKVFTIPHGVGRNLLEYRSNSASGDILKTLNVQKPFALFVGLLTPRKGVLELIEAYDQTRSQSGLQNLVLIGIPGFGFDKIVEKINLSQSRDTIIKYGPADDAALATLYREAAFYCLPSHHEGFGLPVLEAMLLGCPVITSDSSSLPEVAGDAGLIFPVKDSGALGQQMVRLAQDSALAASLQEQGIKRAEAYTWEATARKTVEVYRKVAGGELG